MECVYTHTNTSESQKHAKYKSSCLWRRLNFPERGMNIVSYLLNGMGV